MEQSNHCAGSLSPAHASTESRPRRHNAGTLPNRYNDSVSYKGSICSRNFQIDHYVAISKSCSFFIDYVWFKRSTINTSD